MITRQNPHPSESFNKLFLALRHFIWVSVDQAAHVEDKS